MFLILCLIPQWGLGSSLPRWVTWSLSAPWGGSGRCWALESRKGRPGGRARTGGGLWKGEAVRMGGKTLVSGGLGCVWCPCLWWDRFGGVTLNPHLSEDSSATPEKLPVLSPGSMMHLEASVHFSPSISMKIQVDQCYGTNMEQPGHSRRLFMVVNSRGSVMVGAGYRGSFSSHPGVLQDLLMERDMQSLETALECPVSLFCHRCLHGEKLGNVSVQHQRGGSVLQLSILAPTLEDEPKEEQVRWE